MNEKTTAPATRPATSSGSLVFGIAPDHDALVALKLDLGAIVQADARAIGAGMPIMPGGAAILRAICPLFAPPTEPHHDAISVIDALSDVGFLGEVIVLAPPLLRPKMVETELRSLTQGRRLRLIAGVLPPLTDI